MRREGVVKKRHIRGCGMRVERQCEERMEEGWKKGPENKQDNVGCKEREETAKRRNNRTAICTVVQGVTFRNAEVH